MAVTLFFGIRLSGKPYERIAHKLDENAYSTYKVENLKRLLVDDLLGNHSETSGPSALELVYCGSVLDDSVELSKEGIKSGSTIHVFDKTDRPEPEPIAFTEEEIADASKAYRSICFNSRPNNLFPKVIRPEVINKVLERYPEFYSDTGAFAILKDAVLLEKMIHSYQAKLIGDQYPILIKSAKFMAETMIAVMKKNPVNPAQRIRTEDSSESSEGDSPQASPSRSNDSQRISRNQLAAALLFAGTASLNSLSSIAQRTGDNDEEMATTSNTTPPTQTSAVSTADPSTSTVEATSVEAPTDNSTQRYAAELQIMRDMGLTEENSNLQALLMCNGNVEAAVTLVLGLGNFA
ncbi:ubiquitin-like protein 7 isoform X2 [Bradysia coprophila]|uniref:ubiquitin-like protein 7 isoform X2 n=1 Tax=Bradysia coprophila TaxID=38358 RepID=UPI00187DB386|nr:ubiquitin-like protein 7 isoform X2 [Bradysia coprophila]